jgi:flagellar protein FlaG
MNTVMQKAIRGLERLDLSLPTPNRAPAQAPTGLFVSAPVLPVPAAAAQPQAAVEPHAAAKAAALEANQKLAEKGSELAFEFDDALGRMIFKLIDTRTREVVRQIPSEAMLAVAHALAVQTATGAILSTDA